jgi:exosortase/archaeosortase
METVLDHLYGENVKFKYYVMTIYTVKVFVILTCSGIRSVWSCSDVVTVLGTDYVNIQFT